MMRLGKLLLASLLLSPVLALAAVPSTVAFSARVADNGSPVTGSQSFTFVLWNDPTAGTAVWTEGPRSITVNDGVVATSLGDVANGGVALPAFNGSTPLWLEVTMGTTVFAPRMAIQTVPYAFSVGSILPNIVPGGVNIPFISSLATGANYGWGATFTPPSNGYCIVAVSITIYNGAVANTSGGPYFRIGVQRGGVSGDDGVFGFYPGPLGANGYANMSRTRVIPVTGGQATAFGCAVLFPPTDWVGDSVDCIVDKMCFY